MAWAYQILNAKADADKKSQLQTRVRLFRDGKEVYSEAPDILNADMPEELRRIIAHGKMQLVQASPGDYDLQIIVKDLLAKEKASVASQSIDFEVPGAE